MNHFSIARPLRRALMLGGTLALAAASACAQAQPTVVHNFGGGAGGASPYAPVIEASDGFLYGTASSGGADGGWGYGLVYRVRRDGSGYGVVHYFDNFVEGGAPFGKVIEGLDGALYGVTFSGDEGGTSPLGAVYRLTKEGVLSVLHSFTAAEGAYTRAGLVQGSDGTLYGATMRGNANNGGNLFSIKPDGSGFRLLHQFDNQLGGGAPQGTLVIGKDGRLYGTAHDGGTGFNGVVFSIARDGSDFKLLHAFTESLREGIQPTAGLVEGKDGWFYGTATGGTGGGAYSCNCGTVYRVNAARGFETVLSFGANGTSTDRNAMGSTPVATLTFGPNGHLYGSTTMGGTAFGGTLFEIGPKGKLIGVQPLQAATGNSPWGSLLLASDGQLYGTTNSSGSANGGTIVRLDPSVPLPALIPPLPNVASHLGKNVVKLGARTLLEWVSSDADRCEASGAWSGPRQPEGRTLVKPTASGEYSYTLTCSNSAGSASVTSVLKVRAPK